MPAGPLGQCGTNPWHGPRPSLPASLEPLGGYSRGLGAGEAMCCLSLGVLEGLTSPGLAGTGCQAHTLAHTEKRVLLIRLAVPMPSC